MKNLKITLLAFLLIVSFQCLAQTPPAKTWYYNKLGEKVLVKERWSENENGFKHGKYILYKTDGNPKTTGTYNHGKKHGVWKVYDETPISFESLEYTYTYVNDELNGAYKLVHGRDGLLEQGNLRNGVKDGKWKQQVENIDKQKVFQEGIYVDGKGQGKWIFTTLDNKPAGYAMYEKGELISVFYINGVNILETTTKEAEDKQKAHKEIHDRIDLADKKAEKLRKKLRSADGTLADLTEYLHVYDGLSGKDPVHVDHFTESATYKVKEYAFLDPFKNFFEPNNSQSFLHLENIPDLAVYAVYNYLKDKTSIDLASLTRRPSKEIWLYKLGGNNVDYVSTEGYKALAFNPDGLPKINLISERTSSDSKKTFIVDNGNTSTINLQESLSNAQRFNDLSEKDKFNVMLAYTYQFFNENCLDADNFNSFLYRTQGLTTENKVYIFHLLSYGMYSNKPEKVFCKSKATTNGEALRLTYMGYLNWLSGDQAEAIKMFKEAKATGASFKRYRDDEWVESTYEDYLVKYFHKYYMRGEYSEASVIEIPNEKELIKVFKNL
jgi:antitoxin component YwqK of YwqJK toxin-antitoxin module